MNRTSLLAFISEFGPLVSFFIAGKLFDFYTAVAILMATTLAAVTLSWQLDRRIPWLPIISAFFVVIGGVVTLSLRVPDAVIFADTLYYASISGVLGVTLLRGRLLFKTLFHSVFAITDTGWKILSWRWFWFLLLAAVANEIARAVLSPEAWIDYRFYKSMVITAFALYQFTCSRKHRLPDEANSWGLRIKPSSQRAQG